MQLNGGLKCRLPIQTETITTTTKCVQTPKRKKTLKAHKIRTQCRRVCNPIETYGETESHTFRSNSTNYAQLLFVIPFFASILPLQPKRTLCTVLSVSHEQPEHSYSTMAGSICCEHKISEENYY